MGKSTAFQKTISTGLNRAIEKHVTTSLQSAFKIPFSSASMPINQSICCLYIRNSTSVRIVMRFIRKPAVPLIDADPISIALKNRSFTLSPPVNRNTKHKDKRLKVSTLAKYCLVCRCSHVFSRRWQRAMHDGIIHSVNTVTPIQHARQKSTNVASPASTSPGVARCSTPLAHRRCWSHCLISANSSFEGRRGEGSPFCLK